MTIISTKRGERIAGAYLLLYSLLCISILLAEDASAGAFPRFLTLPRRPLRMCVPEGESNACQQLEVFNVHALPEEDRVVLILWKKMHRTDHKLHFTDQFRCVFHDNSPSRRPESVRIKFIDRATLLEKNKKKYSDVRTAQCALPSWTKRALQSGQSIKTVVTSVDYLGRTRSEEYNVRVPPRPVRKKLLGMCGAMPMFHLGNTLPKIAQWLEYYLYLSPDTHFYMYLDKGDLAVAGAMTAIMPYIRAGLVTIVWVPTAWRGYGEKYDIQQATGNDCMYRFKHVATWVGVHIDYDEILAPLAKPSYITKAEHKSPAKNGMRLIMTPCNPASLRQRFDRKDDKIRIEGEGGVILCAVNADIVDCFDRLTTLQRCQRDSVNQTWRAHPQYPDNLEVLSTGMCMDVVVPRPGSMGDWDVGTWTCGDKYSQQLTIDKVSVRLDVDDGNQMCLTAVATTQSSGSKVRAVHEPAVPPRFRSVLKKVPESAFYLDLAKWPVRVPNATTGWAWDAPWLLDVDTVWPTQDTFNFGKSLVRPERIEVMWIHQPAVATKADDYYSRDSWTEQGVRIARGNHSAPWLFQFALLHFSQRPWDRAMDYDYGPPFAYPYLKEASKAVRQRMIRRFNISAFNLRRK